MNRTACVWIPQFELRERLASLEQTLDQTGDPGDQLGAVILADIGAPGARVIDASAEAQALGVRPQMPMVRARALCPEALLIPPNGAAHRAARERILAGLYRFAPVVGRDDLEAFFVSLVGLERLHPDENVLAEELRLAVEEEGFPAAVAIADSPVSAWIIARAQASFGSASSENGGVPLVSGSSSSAPSRRVAQLEVVPRGKDREAVATLPLAALPMSEQVVRLCRALGLDRVGELAKLPMGALTRRFGREGAVLEARSRARARDLFEVSVPEQVEEAELHLDQPTDDYEVLLFLHKNVLDRLVRQVAATRRCIAALEITLILADSERSRVVHRIRPARPTLDGRLLLDLLVLWLQSGPSTDLVDSIVMRVPEVGEATARQLRLFEKHEDLASDAFSLACSRLAAAFGREALVQPRLAERHRPEERLAWRCPPALVESDKKPKNKPKKKKEKKKARVRGWVERGLGRRGAQPADELFAELELEGRDHATGALDQPLFAAGESVFAAGERGGVLPPALDLVDPPHPIALRGSWLRLPAVAGAHDKDGAVRSAGAPASSQHVVEAPEVIEVGRREVVVVEEIQGKVIPLGLRSARAPRGAHRRRGERWRRVVERLGPYALEGEWWEPDGFARRYELLTLDDGCQLWVFHDGRGAFLQAYLD